MKRIYHESVDGQSGYSSLVSDYVDISAGEAIESLSQINEVDEDSPAHRGHRGKPVGAGVPSENVIDDSLSPDRNGHVTNKPTNENNKHCEESELSMPADENLDSKNNFNMIANSPRQSITNLDHNPAQSESEDDSEQNSSDRESSDEEEAENSDEGEDSEQSD